MKRRSLNKAKIDTNNIGVFIVGAIIGIIVVLAIIAFFSLLGMLFWNYIVVGIAFPTMSTISFTQAFIIGIFVNFILELLGK